jgi:vacuolar-type H+-ATPase subunit I/STV1
MIFPEKMLRVEIEIEAAYSDSVLEMIGKEGLLHIDQVKALPENEAEASRVKTLLILVQKYMAALEIKVKHYKRDPISHLDQCPASAHSRGTPHRNIGQIGFQS